MADIVRCAGHAFLEHSRSWINWQHRKVLLAIVRCRTAALGGHRDRCTGCGHTATISYNSCRNRHCPRCQGNARRNWLKARERELLPTRYVHAVFTLPRELAPLALQNKRLIYNLLFHASAETLLEVARNHARRRTALRRATPAALAASTRSVRRLNLCSHPRLLPVLRRARRLLVSTGQNSLNTRFLTLHIGPQRATAPTHPAIRQSDTDQLSLFLIPLHPLRPIQST
jgi:hypothetical protein